MESLDRLFELFSRERRRYALYALDEAEGSVDIDDLAEQVRRWETDGEGLPAETDENVVLSLEHTHLPKAARAEYIEYDRADGEIRITGSPTEFQIVINVSEAVERPEDGELFDPDVWAPEELLSRFTADT